GEKGMGRLEVREGNGKINRDKKGMGRSEEREGNGKINGERREWEDWMGEKGRGRLEGREGRESEDWRDNVIKIIDIVKTMFSKKFMNEVVRP
ncbi:MAG: hypothetical protein ACK56F_18905, partial [bacterium]